ncbi:hypothetical protein C4588_04260 [Candidatus Parcubacteria bacterium]|jgi:hypothetical protein|nr:MAG: hypothetical protein C4588_04260 [Candidatus Parcubacteria bacterium]
MYHDNGRKHYNGIRLGVRTDPEMQDAAAERKADYEKYLRWLRRDLMIFPQPKSLILAARYLVDYEPNVSQWVRVLAAGQEMNADLIEKVLIALLDNQTVA